MQRLIVQYKVKPEQADENQRYVEAVFAELAEKAPEGLRYASFRLADGVSFVHIASIETADGKNPLPEFESFKAFTKDLRARCDVPPNALGAKSIGEYRVFEDEPAESA
jgi:hypothetical protein